MTERDIIRRLQEKPVPPPPEDLAARIINDIPDDIEIHPDLAEVEPGRRFIHRRPVWLAAAAAAAVALTAAVTWELRNERPADAMFSQSRTAEVAHEKERLEVSPQARAEEVITPTSGPAAAGGKPDNTWSMLGVVEDDAQLSEGHDARTPVEAGKSGELKRQTPGRDQSAVVQQPAPTVVPVMENLARSVEKQLPRRKAMVKDIPPNAPIDGTRSQRENAGGSTGMKGRTDASAPSPGERSAAPQAAGLGTARLRSAGDESEESITAEETNGEAFTDEIILASPPSEPPPEPIVVTSAAPVVDVAAGKRENAKRAAPADPRSQASTAEVRARKEKEISAQLRALGYIGDSDIGSPTPPPILVDKNLTPAAEIQAPVPAPSTGGTTEPNEKPYGDVFFEHSGVNPFVDSEDDALSTFGLDVDTGSYTVAGRYLHDGNLPPREAIRVEEFVNFFDYGDPPPRRGDFRLAAEGAPSAFMQGDRYYTLRLAVKAREVDADDRPPAVLIFCIDVSGSMARESRLELVKKALHELLQNLRRDDHVGLVIYGSTGEVLLRPTTNHDEIRRAFERLRSGGSTNAEEGLSLAYDLLDDGQNDGRIRRVILCSDGVANVGRTGPASILERIQREAGEGIELTTVGFGMGNYNDSLMEQLADAGDGRYAYVDDITEARRIFVEELTGTLFTLGHEAKAQVEFDPKVVTRWRLLGYENRDIADDRFRDPTVDAGEVGAGHTVTAVYEVKLQDDVSRSDIVATLRYRYRPTGRENVVEMDEKLRMGDLAKSWEEASSSLKLASLVAEFAELLKGTYWAKDGSLEEVLRRLQRLQSDFAGDGRVAELTGLVAQAVKLQPDS